MTALLVRARRAAMRAGGPLLLIALIALVDAANRQGHHLPEADALALAFVVLVAWRGGVRRGLLAALLSVAYFAFTDSAPGQLFRYTDADVRQLLGIGLTAPAVAVLAGSLRERLSRLLARLRDEASRNAVETARLRREAAESQETLARVVEIDPDGVVILDREGRFSFANAAAEAIFGVGRREITARRYDDPAWRLSRPAGEPLAPEQFPFERVLRTGRPVADFEFAVSRPDGRRIVVSMSAAPLRGRRDAVVGVVGSLRDITERERAAAARRFLDDASTVLSSSLDYERTLQSIARLAVPELATYCLVYVVEAAGPARLMATAHADASCNQLLSAIWQPPPGPAGDALVARVLRTGEAVRIERITDAYLRAIARDAAQLELLRRLEPRSGMAVPLVARGEVLGGIIFVRAASEPRYGAEELALAQELAHRAGLAMDNARLYREAAQASRAKSEFLAVMSHEFRTPLTAVIGYTDLLDAEVAGPLTAEQRKKLANIRSSAWHLSELIERILAFARMEAGEEEVRTASDDVVQLVRTAAELVEPEATRKGIELRLDLPAEQVVVETDGSKLEEVVLNLLSNAIKFTHEGSVVASLRAAYDEVVVEVRDTGVGIAAEDLPHIFDPFWQVDQSTTRRVGGTGLGLSVTRRLLRLLGGRIDVESAPGRGSLFRVRLPVRRDAAAALGGAA